jgi:hypothetical protein
MRLPIVLSSEPCSVNMPNSTTSPARKSVVSSRVP